MSKRKCYSSGCSSTKIKISKKSAVNQENKEALAKETKEAAEKSPKKTGPTLTPKSNSSLKKENGKNKEKEKSKKKEKDKAEAVPTGRKDSARFLLPFIIYHCLRGTYEDMYLIEGGIIVFRWTRQTKEICTNLALKGWAIFKDRIGSENRDCKSWFRNALRKKEEIEEVVLAKVGDQLIFKKFQGEQAEYEYENNKRFWRFKDVNYLYELIEEANKIIVEELIKSFEEMKISETCTDSGISINKEKRREPEIPLKKSGKRNTKDDDLGENKQQQTKKSMKKSNDKEKNTPKIKKRNKKFKDVSLSFETNGKKRKAPPLLQSNDVSSTQETVFNQFHPTKIQSKKNRIMVQNNIDHTQTSTSQYNEEYVQPSSKKMCHPSYSSSKQSYSFYDNGCSNLYSGQFIHPQQQLPMTSQHFGSFEQSEKKTFKNEISSYNRPVCYYLNQNNCARYINQNPKMITTYSVGGVLSSQTTLLEEQHQAQNLPSVILPHEPYFSGRIADKNYLKYCQGPYPETEPQRNHLVSYLPGKEDIDPYLADKVDKTNATNNKTYELSVPHHFNSIQTIFNLNNISEEPSYFSQVPCAEMAPSQNLYDNCFEQKDEGIGVIRLEDERKDEGISVIPLEDEVNINLEDEPDPELWERFMASNKDNPLEEFLTGA